MLLASWRAPALALLAALTATGHARAFEVRNDTSRPILVWTLVGTFHVELPPGAGESCEWTNPRCNVDGGPNASVSIMVVVPAARFMCVVSLPVTGKAVVSEIPRGYLPSNLSCQTFTQSGVVVDTSPLRDHTGSRSVRFLATADPQFWWEDKPVTSTRRNTIARSTMTRMLWELASSCTSAGCAIRGVTVSGDLTQYSRRNEFAWYLESLDRYRHYVYDGLGNHDLEPDYPYPSPLKCALWPAKCVDVAQIREHVSRGSVRTTIPTNSGDPHYSWDWDDVHLVQLNLVPRDTPNTNMRDLGSFGALRFLARDLAIHVGTSRRPVILFHHYGFDTEESAHPSGVWWTEGQRRDYWNVIARYNVIAIFAGHNHYEREQDPFIAWHRPAGALGPDSIATFVAGAALNGAFLDVRIDDQNLVVRKMGLVTPTSRFSTLRVYFTRTIPLR